MLILGFALVVVSRTLELLRFVDSHRQPSRRLLLHFFVAQVGALALLQLPALRWLLALLKQARHQPRAWEGHSFFGGGLPDEELLHVDLARTPPETRAQQAAGEDAAASRPTSEVTPAHRWHGSGTTAAELYDNEFFIAAEQFADEADEVGTSTCARVRAEVVARGGYWGSRSGLGLGVTSTSLVDEGSDKLT